MNAKRLLSTLAVTFFVASAWSQQPAATPQAQAPQQQLDPNSPAGMAQQARRLVGQGKLDEAWAQVEKAMQADPKSVDAHQGAGIILDLQGKYAEGRKHLQEALNLADEKQKPGVQ